MILVTGANGLLGKSLTKHLNHNKIRYIKILHSNTYIDSNEGFSCDITNIEHIKQLAKALPKIDSVIHLAGFISISLLKNINEPLKPLPGKTDMNKLYSVNALGTSNIIELCNLIETRQIIFSSSQTVYGMPKTIPVDEFSPCSPLEHYAMSKYAAEKILEVATSSDVNATILRIPGMFSEDRAEGLIHNMCKQALESQVINIKSEIPLPIDVIHVQDVVSALLKAIIYKAEGWSCFNISTGLPSNLVIIAERIASLVDNCKVNNRCVNQPIVQLDPTKANFILKWTAEPMEKRLYNYLKEMKC